MNFDNKTLIIIGLIIIALVSFLKGQETLGISIATGLLGYLSHDIKRNNYEEELKQ